MKLEVKGISKSYGANVAVNNLSFTAESGKAFALLGGNGAGKTTTLRMILSIINSDTGTIKWDGHDVEKMRLRFGYLPEERGLYPKSAIMDQLVYLGKLKSMSTKQAKSSANYWLERLSMSEHTNKRLEELSKGNQQKIQLVAALIHDPDCVILDEPFSGLDPINSELLRSVISELIKGGKILIFSSHRMDYVEEFCNDVCMLKNGNVVLHGQLASIKKSYARTSVKIRTVHELTPALQQMGLEVLEMRENRYLVTVRDEIQAKELLKRVTSLDMLIEQFEIVEPSLHQIYLDRMGE